MNEKAPGGDLRRCAVRPPGAQAKVLELDQRNIAALNNLAFLLADGNPADEALKFAQHEARRVFGSDAN